MKSPMYEIKHRLYAILTNAVTIDGTAVPVRSFAATDVDRYIWIAAVRGSEDWTKDEFGGDWFFDINCIDRVGIGAEDMTNVHDIAEQVGNALQPTPDDKLTLSNGFTDHRLQLVNERDLSSITEDGMEFRIVMEYRVMLSQPTAPLS